MYTPAEVAKAMRVSKKTVLRWFATKSLSHYKIGHNTVLVSEDAIAKFLTERQVA